MNDRIVRPKELTKMICASLSTLHRWEKEGIFPKRMKTGKNSVGWWLSDIERWKQEKGFSGKIGEEFSSSKNELHNIQTRLSELESWTRGDEDRIYTMIKNIQDSLNRLEKRIDGVQIMILQKA